MGWCAGTVLGYVSSHIVVPRSNKGVIYTYHRPKQPWDSYLYLVELGLIRLPTVMGSLIFGTIGNFHPLSVMHTLVMQRVQQVLDRQARARSVADGYNLLHLSTDEKKEAKALAVQFLTVELRSCWLSVGFDIDTLIEEAYSDTGPPVSTVVQNMTHVSQLSV